MPKEQKIRLKKIIMILTVFLFCGGALAIFLSLTGTYLPCLFREVTGYLCPGCGATRMFLSIFRLDFVAAFRYNAMLLISLPFIIYIIFEMCKNYVKEGKLIVDKNVEYLTIILIICFVIFGIARNIL